ncbi:phosphotransferase [Nonomuraea angiospora]|uniref:phosphotransferase n=1 Tax=Nonomuraea angiospora TaxID=46172 RepID=UPI00342A1CD1
MADEEVPTGGGVNHVVRVGSTVRRPVGAWTDDALTAVGALLRDYHDATLGFPADPDLSWYFPPVGPAEVICHGDVATYNCVFRDGLPVAFIDFDTAHPGPRIWDVAYAAYRFVSLSDPRHEGVGSWPGATTGSTMRTWRTWPAASPRSGPPL